MQVKKNNIRLYLEILIIIAIMITPFIYIKKKNNLNDKQAYLSGKIDISKDPVQINYRNDDPLDYYDPYDRWKKKGFKLFPLALYKISGIVVAKKLSSETWPVNLGLVWREAANSEHLGYFIFYSNETSLIPRYSKKFKALPREKQWELYDYYFKKMKIQEMWSHTHIFPADEQIFNILKRLEKGDKVMLKGYLASVRGINPYTGKEDLYAESSLRRDDSGIGHLDVRKTKDGKFYLNTKSMSCEILYVTKVVVEK